MQSKLLAKSQTEKQIVVSGYYGFSNLGDDAILEVLIDQLKSFVDSSNIVVLSNNPELTERQFQVRSINRFDLPKFWSVLQNAQLFISGGGGLFQDSTSIKSVFYYTLLHHMAWMAQVKTMVFAQGLGPLNHPLSKAMTKRAFALCDHVTLRDSKSIDLLKKWGIEAHLTADPVWCLEPDSSNLSIQKVLDERKDGLLVALSLRQFDNLDIESVKILLEVMIDCLPDDTQLVPLVLQKKQDSEILDYASSQWKSRNRDVLDLEFEELEKPSQWLAVISQLDLVVGMRLHSLIMALSSGVPTIGLAYAPKVEEVMKEFGQPFLNLTNVTNNQKMKIELSKLFNRALSGRHESCQKIKQKQDEVKGLACQNFQLLDRILSR